MTDKPRAGPQPADCVAAQLGAWVTDDGEVMSPNQISRAMQHTVVVTSAHLIIAANDGRKPGVDNVARELIRTFGARSRKGDT